MGLFATVRGGKPDERTISTILYMLYALPSYVAALFLLVLFAVRMEGTAFELPLFGMVSDNYQDLSAAGKVTDILRHMILPMTCYTYGSLAYYSRFVKSNMEEVIRQDYIRTARAKGLHPLRVMVVHALRNALLPVLTVLGNDFGSYLSGAVLTETIFAWPGLGRYTLEAVAKRDLPAIQGAVLVMALVFVLVNLLVDLTYAWIDPRTRREAA